MSRVSDGFLPIYTDADGSVEHIVKRSVGVLGYGAQGRAHALNLRDSGVKVVVGLHDTSKSASLAREEGFEVHSVASCAQSQDVLAILLPDELHQEVYAQEIAPYLKPGQTLIFAHGFSVHFKQICAPEGVGVALVAPKGPGRALRENYQNNSGLFALVGVEQENSTHNAKEIALAYACALGCGRVGILQTTFKHEACSDLFGEQAVLCGGLVYLLRHAFEVLVEAGYPKELAYFECVHEIKLIADLIYSKGVAMMQEHISNTAEYGGLLSGGYLVDDSMKARMQEVLKQIEGGDFAQKFLEEKTRGFAQMHHQRAQLAQHPLEEVGAHLRSYLFKGN
ncbi:ketol-acid reductoisomerase [Helicobacter felis]|uniref:ketol-acid reductoisomerase n=1 Tax=Helicobacter felis TaxID=214 RepID=UPI000CF052C7|nr:ketol-acid reductoisomerase [Helicobacter felis]